MKKIADYTILEKINETRNSNIYRAYKENADNTVIIKLLKSEYPSQSEVARFKQEYNIIKDIEIDSVVKTYDIIQYQEMYALVLEDFNGVSLKKIISEEKIDLPMLLHITKKIAEALGELHTKNIIHKDIKPSNILINIHDKTVKITDFGIARLLSHGNEEIYDPNVIEGSLVYMSPEQTGRINRPIDYRTDFYSLGITLYEALTGTVPFKFIDPMQIIHSHIARLPEPPDLLDPEIPLIISSILMKLLAKNPEDRYQNGFGLMADIMECIEQLERQGKINIFEIGSKDIPIKYIIPRILVGREKEVNNMMNFFARVNNGKKELLFVHGQPGVGKSALVNEIRKPIIANRGYFISGKYDQLRGDVPYSAIIQAFNELIGQILCEGNERIALFKKKLLKALGVNGKVITDVMPNVELIISEQPPVAELSPEQAQNRFNFVFKDFIGAFTENENPLVLFLDDLQWADLASLHLMKNIITDPDIKHFFFIGSYRDNEVLESHPLYIILNEIKTMECKINNIHVLPLTVENVNDMISYFLRCNKQKSLSLAQLVCKKTHGNPFFVNQFMKSLYEDRLLILNPLSGWEWNIEAINLMQVTENVVEFMASKIILLNAESQNILKISSCIGNRFDLEIVSTIANKPVEATLAILSDAIHDGLVEVADDCYVFYHDRIQEAVYSLIPRNEKIELHYRIGKLALAMTPCEEVEKKIFYIVNHFNQGMELVNSQEEKDRIVELNYIAGIRAKNSAAYAAALTYLKTGVALAGDNSWARQKSLTFLLHLECAVAAYHCAEYNAMEQYIAALFSHVDSLQEKVKVYGIRLSAYMAQNKMLEAVNVGITVLKLFGVNVPKKATKLHILTGLLRIKFALKSKTIEDIVNFPEMAEPDKIALLQILTFMSSSIYWARPDLIPLLILKMVHLSIKHGNHLLSSGAYSGFGLILCHIGRIDDGYRFGKMAMELLNRNRNYPEEEMKLSKVGVKFIFNTFIRHWKEPVDNELKDLFEIYQYGRENGSLEYASHAIMIYAYYSFLAGKEISFVKQELKKYSSVLKKLQQRTDLHILRMYHQLAIHLADQDYISTSLKGEIYDEEIMLPLHIETGDRTCIYHVYFIKLMLSYLLQKYDEAMENIKIMEHEIKKGTGAAALPVPVYYFYDSLTRLALFNKRKRHEQKKILKRVIGNQKKMQNWAAHAPMNFMHKYYLVEAEKERTLGHNDYAAELYDKAIVTAHENGYIQEEALANELAAKFYIDLGRKKNASMYMIDAWYHYRKWGASAKIRLIEKDYLQLINRGLKSLKHFNMPNDTHTSSSTSISHLLDLSTIIKLFQAFANEFDIFKILEKIMKMSIENAGAQKGFVILENENDNKLYIEIEGTINGDISILKSNPVEDNDNLSYAIVHYAYNIKNDLVLDNACEEGLFINDPYIKRNKTKSVLCGPIIYKSKMIGILYLENNLIASAFTTERLQFLRVLTAQAAISIENARLLTQRENAAKLEKEMEIAAHIQTTLLPKEPSVKGYEIMTYMAPADLVGGDYYDVLSFAEREWIIIGDVAGHGITAGLIMMMVQTAIYVTLQQYPGIQPSQLLKLVNMAVFDKIKDIDDEKYMTITAFVVQENGELIFAGSHQDILIFRSQSKSVELVQTDGMWLGVTKDIGKLINDSSLVLHPGDTMLLYTDGIIEAWNKKNMDYPRNKEENMFGIDRLKGLFSKCGTSPVDQIKKEIILALEEYHHNDDITFIILRRLE